MNFIKKNIVLISLFILNLATHFIWIFNTDFITYGDARVYVPETQRELLFNSSQIYNSNANLGAVELSGGTKLIELIHGLSANLGLNYNFSFRLIYLYPFTLLAPFIVYYFFRKFFDKPWAIFIASVIYLFNTYTLILQTAGVLMLIGDLFLVLTLLFYYKFFYENKNSLNILMIIFSGFLLSTYEFRIFYISCIVTSLFVLHYFFYTKKDYKVFIWHLFFVFSVLILNMHWLLPLINLGQLTDNELFSRNIFGSSYFDVSSSFTLFHRFWTFEKPSVFKNQTIPLYFWFIPIFTILGIYYSRKKKFSIFFLTIFLLGVFLTKQEGVPFSQIYKWLYTNFPGFNAFREASKFYILNVLGISALIGYFVNEYKFTNLKVKYSIYALLFLIFIGNTYPIFSGKIDTLFVPRKYPQQYQEFNKKIESENQEFRILWVPTNSKWGAYSNQNPVLGMPELDQKFSFIKKIPDFIEYSKPKNSNVNLLRQKFSDNILDRLSIKYVIVPISIDDEDLFSDYGKSRVHFLEILKNSKYLTPKEFNENDIAIFENSDFRPLIYTTKQLEDFNKVSPYSNVEFKKISPTVFEINLKNIKDPVYLNFSENYSTDWTLYLGDYNLESLILSQMNQVSGTNHIKSDLGLNTFYIDPQEIIKNNNNENITINKDKSINLKITLYFKTQSYFYIGLIIAASYTILIVLATLILVKKNGKK
jgi:hypothetical protein